jgi:hypothetical protein
VRISTLKLSRRVALISRIMLGVALLLMGALASPPVLEPDTAVAAGALPFEVGERLVYHVQWNPPLYLFFLPPMEAGEATLSLAGETQYQNRRAFKITFTARSSGALAKLARLTVNDYYEFTTDAETFCTFRVTRREREGKRMRDIDIVYLPENRKLHLREIDASTPARRVIRDMDYNDIPPCVKDLFSALYAVRQSKLEAGWSTRVLVGENQDVQQVEIHVGKKDRIATPAGDFTAWPVTTPALIWGLFKQGGQFRMWLSADDRKMPIKFEATVEPYGKVTGILKEARF